jgi:hypothetical protein
MCQGEHAISFEKGEQHGFQTSHPAAQASVDIPQLRSAPKRAHRLLIARYKRVSAALVNQAEEQLLSIIYSGHFN